MLNELQCVNSGSLFAPEININPKHTNSMFITPTLIFGEKIGFVFLHTFQSVKQVTHESCVILNCNLYHRIWEFK